MFNKNFVVVVKVNGKVLREVDGVVKIPFGSEYTILLKNLDTKTAAVEVSIDGQDVLDNSRLVIYGNAELELHGFLKGNDVKNKFKFIEKTEEISNYRGDRPDDGVVRVKYTFEKPTIPYWYTTKTWYQPMVYDYDRYYYGPPAGCMGNSSILCSCSSFSQQDNGDGITVKGSDDVNQRFNTVTLNTLESESHVITLKLRGTDLNKPMTVRDKVTCETCGRRSKTSAKYCENCGSYLEW